MRLVLSRKGFDSGSGGCPSPILPNGSMIALPIPDETSPVRYRDLVWHGHNLGHIAETLTRGKVRRDNGAHLDPDLRAEMRTRPAGWRPLLGQLAAAQGHLRNMHIGEGDLFLFWGLFRQVDSELRWTGPPLHVIWGWLQVGIVAPVDSTVRASADGTWGWAAGHPHLAYSRNSTNTLYVADDRLAIPGASALPGSGVFESFDDARRLTAEGAKGPGMWKLPLGFLPGRRQPLSYHTRPNRWTHGNDHVLLKAASPGQEFVLDGDAYPEVVQWVAELIASAGPGLRKA
jgi:hypothetical protein